MTSKKKFLLIVCILFAIIIHTVPNKKIKNYSRTFQTDLHFLRELNFMILAFAIIKWTRNIKTCTKVGGIFGWHSGHYTSLPIKMHSTFFFEQLFQNIYTPLISTGCRTPPTNFFQTCKIINKITGLSTVFKKLRLSRASKSFPGIFRNLEMLQY